MQQAISLQVEFQLATAGVSTLSFDSKINIARMKPSRALTLFLCVLGLAAIGWVGWVATDVLTSGRSSRSSSVGRTPSGHDAGGTPSTHDGENWRRSLSAPPLAYHLFSTLLDKAGAESYAREIYVRGDARQCNWAILSYTFKSETEARRFNGVLAPLWGQLKIARGQVRPLHVSGHYITPLKYFVSVTPDAEADLIKSLRSRGYHPD